VTDYRVIAKRWAHGWELHVKGVGVTQTKSLAAAKREVSAYLDLMLGDDADRTITIIPSLGDALDRSVRAARAASEQLLRQQRDVGEKSRAAVRQLADAGLTGAEIAAVLNVSPQRVSQLASTKKSSRVQNFRSPGRHTSATATKTTKHAAVREAKRSEAKRSARAERHRPARHVSARRSGRRHVPLMADERLPPASDADLKCDRSCSVGRRIAKLLLPGSASD
jgi:predicted transcriptional regulator